MKRIIRLIIIAASAVVLGAMLVGISIGIFIAKQSLTAKKGTAVSSNYNKQEFAFQADTIKEINLNITADSAKIIKGEGNEVKVSFYETDNGMDYDVSCEEGILTVTQDVPNTVNFNFISIPSPSDFLQVKEEFFTLCVEIPEGYEGTFIAKQTSGLVELDDIVFKAGVDLQSTAGGMYLNNITGTEDITVTVSGGEIKMTDISCDKTLTMESTAGGITMTNVEAKDIIASTISGGITGKNIKAGVLDANANSGGIHLKEVDVSEEIKTATNAGGIRVELVDSAENYTIKSRTATGSNNLSGKELYGKNSGAKKITASAMAGSIHYEFAEEN